MIYLSISNENWDRNYSDNIFFYSTAVTKTQLFQDSLGNSKSSAKVVITHLSSANNDAQYMRSCWNRWRIYTRCIVCCSFKGNNRWQCKDIQQQKQVNQASSFTDKRKQSNYKWLKLPKRKNSKHYRLQTVHFFIVYIFWPSF